MTTGGKSYYYLTDVTGDPLGLADDAGKRTHTYAYGPTGMPGGTTVEAVPQPYRYTGAYADPTGRLRGSGRADPILHLRWRACRALHRWSRPCLNVGVLEVDEKRKLRIFTAVSGVVSVAALIQGSLIEGSGRVILLTLGVLGVAGIGMLTYAMRSVRRPSR
ncbi:hypothetical protein [Streptomyces rochei]|uniref:hypothetical protein n=1 Tax=Streptomyces rochei TaxID=1928 RepID=UPI00373E8C0C